MAAEQPSLEPIDCSRQASQTMGRDCVFLHIGTAYTWWESSWVGDKLMFWLVRLVPISASPCSTPIRKDQLQMCTAGRKLETWQLAKLPSQCTCVAEDLEDLLKRKLGRLADWLGRRRVESSDGIEPMHDELEAGNGAQRWR